MKSNYYIAIVVGAVLGMGTSGCALLEKFEKSRSNVVSGSEGKVSADRTAVTDGPVLTPPKDGGASKAGATTQAGGKAVKNKKKKGDGKLSGVSKRELAEARKEAAAGGQETVAIGDLNNGAQSLAVQNALPDGFSINGEWTIYSVRGNMVNG